jgi:integrase
MRRREPEGCHLLKMLGSTIAHISMHLGVPADELDIHRLLDVKSGLQVHLKERGFKRNSIRSYTNYLRILLQKATEFGWSVCSPDIARAWREISVCARTAGCAGVVRYAICKGLRPENFTETDLQHWGEEVLRGGRTNKRVVQVKSHFRKCIFEAGFGSKIPNILPPVKDRIYGVPLSQIPEPVYLEVIDLLKWKTDEFSPGRPYKARHRAVTAENLKKLISRLFGFVVKVQGKTVHHLEELFSQQSVNEFVRWAINQRKVSGRCVAIWLGTLRALRIYPALRGHDFGWVLNLLEELPRDSEVKAKERKERRWVSYDVLADIPEQILRDADQNVDLDKRSRALRFRDALLIRWLATLPWRQRNIRECIVAPFHEGGNMFMAEIPPNSTIAKSRRVCEALKVNPHEHFWQFRFRPHETKNGRAVHAILPGQLIGPLENYLANYRPFLVDVSDQRTLFVNDHGCPFDPTRLALLVENLTLRYTGRQVNPHLFRDIFAIKWLEDHPEDYLTLSKVLWHSNIQTTLQHYGRNFDESHGARRVEEWLDSRKAGF